MHFSKSQSDIRNYVGRQAHILTSASMFHFFLRQSLNYTSKKNLKAIYSTGQIIAFIYKNTTQW